MGNLSNYVLGFRDIAAACVIPMSTFDWFKPTIKYLETFCIFLFKRYMNDPSKCVFNSVNSIYRNFYQNQPSALVPEIVRIMAFVA